MKMKQLQSWWSWLTKSPQYSWYWGRFSRGGHGAPCPKKAAPWQTIATAFPLAKLLDSLQSRPEANGSRSRHTQLISFTLQLSLLRRPCVPQISHIQPLKPCLLCWEAPHFFVEVGSALYQLPPPSWSTPPPQPCPTSRPLLALGFHLSWGSRAFTMATFPSDAPLICVQGWSFGGIQSKRQIRAW